MSRQTITVVVNVVSGELLIDPDGIDSYHRDRIELDPWGAEEETMERADQALNDIGFVRVTNWTDGGGSDHRQCTVKVGRADDTWTVTIGDAEPVTHESAKAAAQAITEYGRVNGDPWIVNDGGQYTGVDIRSAAGEDRDGRLIWGPVPVAGVDVTAVGPHV